jgi:hypothetical protein
MKEHVLEALDVLLSMPGLHAENADEKVHAATVMGSGVQSSGVQGSGVQGSGVQRFRDLEVLD